MGDSWVTMSDHEASMNTSTNVWSWLLPMNMPQCSKKNTSIACVCYGHMLFGGGFKSCLHERGKQMMDHRRGGPKNLVVNMLLDKHPEPKMQLGRAIFHCATQKGGRVQSSVSWFWQEIQSNHLDFQNAALTKRHQLPRSFIGSLYYQPKLHALFFSGNPSKLS